MIQRRPAAYSRAAALPASWLAGLFTGAAMAGSGMIWLPPIIRRATLCQTGSDPFNAHNVWNRP